MTNDLLRWMLFLDLPPCIQPLRGGASKSGLCLDCPGSLGSRSRVKPYAQSREASWGTVSMGRCRPAAVVSPGGRGARPSHPHLQTQRQMTDVPFPIPQATFSALCATRCWDGCRGTKIRLAGCEKSQLFCLMPSICDGGDRY